MHVLGIDAGGTKTLCLLANDRGEVLAQTRASGANLQVMGEFGVEKILHRVMDETLGDRDIKLDAICLGIAGVDRPRDAQTIRDVMRRIGQKTRTVVVNDALVALVGGAGEKAGAGGVRGHRAASWWSRLPGRLRTGMMPRVVPPVRVGGDISSATKAAASGSDEPRCRRWFVSSISAAPTRCLRSLC